MADSYTRPDPDTCLMVTFKVDHEGEQGHPMDHVLKVVQLDEDGFPTAGSFDELVVALRAEIERKVRRRG